MTRALPASVSAVAIAATFPSLMPRSASTELSAVTILPPRMTRSNSIRWLPHQDSAAGSAGDHPLFNREGAVDHHLGDSFRWGEWIPVAGPVPNPPPVEGG